MKKTILKFGLYIALGLSIAVFNSCNKDEAEPDGNFIITASNVVNSSSHIATVKVILDWENDYRDTTIQVPYQNNGFTVELPANIDAKYLEALPEEDTPDGIYISDKTVKTISELSIEAYDSKGNKIGTFGLFEEGFAEEEGSIERSYVMWLYVDKNVTIKGEYSEDEEYVEKVDCELKKGWNAVYCTKSYTNVAGKGVWTYSTTSNKPAGVNYSWYFNGSGYLKNAVLIQKSLLAQPKRN